MPPVVCLEQSQWDNWLTRGAEVETQSQLGPVRVSERMCARCADGV